MRTPLVPAFQAAPEGPILCAFEARRIPAATPSQILRPPGRKELRPRVEYYYRQLKALPRRLRRTLQRRYARSLAGVALLLALGQAPALAATINVGGGCTLVDAITAANTDTATGGCPAGSGADVVALTGNVTLSAVNNTTDSPNGLPSVTSPLTINGGGHTLRRSTVTGTPEFRLLHVADTGSLTLNQITLTNGRAGPSNLGGGAVFNRGTVALADSTVSGNSAYYRGGGLVNVGTLTLTNSTVSGNTADGIFDAYGGGLVNGGTLTLTNSTVSDNTADGIYKASGGGVENGGTLTLTNSTISGNTVDGIYNASGGGFSNFYGTATLTNSTVSGNTGCGVLNRVGAVTATNITVSSNFGGGLCNVYYQDEGPNLYGNATLTNSTVSGNIGGGVFNHGTLTLTNSSISGNTGGGVFNYAFRATTATLTNSTVSGNTAGDKGGGVFNGGTLTLTNSTVSGNTAVVEGGGVNNSGSYNYSGNFYGGTLTIAHSLISGNTAPSSPEVHNYTGPHGRTARVHADNFNLVGTNGDAGVVGFIPGPTDIIPAPGVMLSDILEPLADNRGPTKTHALIVGSPAIDTSPIDNDCAIKDQRGAFRPQGPACDIGAFEVGVEPDPFASPTPTTGCTVNGVPDQPCRGTAGPDRILGTTGNDVMVALEGDDYLNGSSGDNRLFGGEDNDRLIGGNGDDQLFGQTGDDDLRGRVGNDLLEGGDGNDRLKGHEGDDQLRGSDGDDALRGLEGEDTLEGGDGSDLLRGDGGEDTLNGGPGTDRLVGGGGTDRCTSDAEDNVVVLCE